MDFIPDGKLHPNDLAPGLFTALLDNGLRVIIRENHRTPVAICNVWVGTGSNREPEALRGWSHGTEHMLFKGTARRGEGDFAREVAEAGGSTNAGTGYETTNYHITLPADKLPVAVDILSDALFHSAFAAPALDAEREVLVHENHMYDDVPFGYGVTWRWGMELAFDVSPYRHPIGGRDENLRERSREQIIAYWRSSYRPDNAVVVLVGDFAAEDAFALVRRKFGSVRGPDGPPDPRTAMVENPPTEPRHDAPRLRIEQGDIKKCYAKLVFPAPGDKQDPGQVMGVIRQILAEGRSSRLYREIQEERQLIDDFVVMMETGPREGVAVIDLETDTGRLPAALEAVAAILEDIKRTGGTDEELKRARVRVVRGFHFGAETVQGQAAVMGRYTLLDDLPGAFAFPERVACVTRTDVAAMAARVFALDQLSVVIYAPESADLEGLPRDADGLREHLQDVLTSESQPAPAKDLVSTPAGSRSADGGIVNPFVTEHLPCGAEISYRLDRTLPVFALSLTTIGGACTETTSDSGLAALTAAVQVKAAGGLDPATLHGRLEAEGAGVSPSTERDFSGLVLSGLTERMEIPLRLLADLILRPDFPDAEIEQERRLALEELASLQDNPLQLGVMELRRMLYGDHPYGRPLAGTTESLPGLKRQQLLAAHAAAWTTGNLLLTLSGDFDPDVLLPRLDGILAGLPGGRRERPTVEPARTPEGVETRRLQRKINQCVLLLGWPGPLEPNEDRPARMLFKEILNGQSGRLFDALRNKRSLCYNTGVMSTAGFGQGMFLGYVLTAPESEDEARAAMLAELARMRESAVSAAELDRARAKLVGNLLIAAQSNYARVGRAARNRIYDRPADDLDDLVAALGEVAPANIQAMAAKLVAEDRRCEVAVSPR